MLCCITYDTMTDTICKCLIASSITKSANSIHPGARLGRQGLHNINKESQLIFRDIKINNFMVTGST